MKAYLQRTFDVAALPAVYASGCVLKLVRRGGIQNLPWCRRALMQVGVFPIRDHYYEPLFDGRQLLRPLSEARSLPGIDWNLEEQLTLLGQFHFNDELLKLAQPRGTERRFDVGNSSFGPGDFEYLYNLIRLKQPRTIIEIGSGNSTLLALEAARANRAQNPDYRCDHICIEPYEMPWLEQTPVQVIRERVETLDRELFSRLQENDILFIDSSHVIRPQGDVVFEYLELLPRLSPGVIVHIHDIFTPRDYPAKWIVDEVRLWNEQYLLEAFLSHNSSWKIIGAVNYLHHNHFEALASKCPHLSRERKPGSFYIQRTR